MYKTSYQGYVVREAGYYDRPPCFNGKFVFLTACPEEATEAYCMALEHSKYQDSVQVHRCTIYETQTGDRHWGM